jgi:hypothetical protein
MGMCLPVALWYSSMPFYMGKGVLDLYKKAQTRNESTYDQSSRGTKYRKVVIGQDRSYCREVKLDCGACHDYLRPRILAVPSRTLE